MRYTEVKVEYKGHNVKVQVYTDGTESEEELQEKAIKLLDNIMDERILRSLSWEV